MDSNRTAVLHQGHSCTPSAMQTNKLAALYWCSRSRHACLHRRAFTLVSMLATTEQALRTGLQRYFQPHALFLAYINQILQPVAAVLLGEEGSINPMSRCIKQQLQPTQLKMASIINSMASDHLCWTSIQLACLPLTMQAISQKCLVKSKNALFASSVMLRSTSMQTSALNHRQNCTVG